jgi:zinc transport system substrate-binding protein
MPAMARRLAAVLIVVIVAAGGSCASDDGGTGDGRARVVASFFPLAEIARAVGGPDVEVTDLTPPGVEPHDLEPSSRDVDRIEDADVVLYLGGGFQPGVERTVSRADASSRVDLLAEIPERRPGDPHVWLDPRIMAMLTARVADALAAASPAHADAFRQRALAYSTELDALDMAFRSRLLTCDRRLLVTTHDAFGYLARSYQLEQQPLTGLTPDAEPDPRRLAELADLVRSRGVTTVFGEGGGESKSAEALAREAGVRTAVLHTLETPTDGGYIGGMRANLDALGAALGCR